MQFPEVSIAVIAKDEEGSIGNVLREIFDIAQRDIKVAYEIFLVNGSSKDNTVNIAKEFGIDIINVDGEKGVSVRKALEVAKGKYVVLMDADYSHMADDIPKLLIGIEKTLCDMVVISRLKGRSEELGFKNWDNCIRLIGNKLANFIISLRWGIKLTDALNGFRLIKRDVALGLNLQETGFPIEMEMTIKCLKQKRIIHEIAGIERKRLSGVSKLFKRRDFWRYASCFMRNF